MGGWVCVKMGKGKDGWIEFLHNGYYSADFFLELWGVFGRTWGLSLVSRTCLRMVFLMCVPRFKKHEKSTGLVMQRASVFGIKQCHGWRSCSP